MIVRDGRPLGSELIGQPFSDPKYFWSRPSAITPFADNASLGGSDLGPTNPALTEAVTQRIAALHAADQDNTAPVPVDLVATSASGLDPRISPAATYRLQRVARMRALAPMQVAALVTQATAPRQFGLPGEGPRVCVAAEPVLDSR